MAEKYQVLKKDNFMNLMKDTTEYRIEGKGKMTTTTKHTLNTSSCNFRT